MFENCSIPDILRYLSDWVRHGATEDHETIGFEMLNCVSLRAELEEVDSSFWDSEIEQTLKHVPL